MIKIILGKIIDYSGDDPKNDEDSRCWQEAGDLCHGEGVSFFECQRNKKENDED